MELPITECKYLVDNAFRPLALVTLAPKNFYTILDCNEGEPNKPFNFYVLNKRCYYREFRNQE